MKLQKALTMTKPSPFMSGGPPTPMQPVDADDLHVAEVQRVVDMAHRVHVAPADGHRHLVDQLLLLGDVEAHARVRSVQAASMPSSAAMRCTSARSCASSAARRVCSALSAAISPADTPPSAAPARAAGVEGHLAAQQVRPARLARARRARQLHHARRLLGGQFVEEAFDRRDVGKAVQPLAVAAAARPRSAGRAASAPPAAPPTPPAGCSTRAMLCSKRTTRLPLPSNTRLRLFRPSTRRQHLGLAGVDHRLARRLLVAARHQRVQRQRVGVGHRVLLLHQHAEHARFQRGQCAHGAVQIAWPSSAEMTAPLMKWLSLAHSIISAASRSSGLPTRLRGMAAPASAPASVCQWWWLISVSM